MNILIAGGGTGGHLFPAIAVAEEIASTHPDIKITFVGTKRGLESKVIPMTMWELITMDVPSLKGLGFTRKIKTLIFMPRAFVQARRILKKIKPGIVIGVGGYAAGPLSLVAALKGIPTVAMEQNAIAGVTNRILGKFVKKIFISFEESRKYFSKKKTILSGNPVREKIVGLADHKVLSKNGHTIFIFGGSQGARSINEGMLEAAAHLGAIKKKVHIIHQVGMAADTERFRAFYNARDISAEVHNFIDDMGEAYSRADLVICRAGATSVAELSVIGLPAIFIPYPHAADNHQEANARSLVEKGAAVMVLDRELDGEKLAAIINDLIGNPLRLTGMSEAMKDFGHPDAAEVVVKESIKLVR